jgi:predicted metal-binding membrane protein
MKIPTVPRIGCVIMTNTSHDPARRGRRAFYVFCFFSGLAFAASAAATIYFCRTMSGGMHMPGGWLMSMMWMRMPGQTWTTAAAMFLLMWLAMMVAMMLPSAWPMLLNFRQSLVRPEEHRGEHRRIGMPMMLVAAGYFFVWLLFGATIYWLGVEFALAAMRWDWLSRLVPVLSGALLLAAGALQFTAWKMSGLRRCRAPDCGELPADDAWLAGWRHGLKQGASCFICCTPPMLMLLALGVMNWVAMIFIAAIITTEKLIAKPEPFVRVFGSLAIVIGAVMTVRGLL